MSDNLNIEWTDATWNPVRGCTKVSAGCTHCHSPEDLGKPPGMLGLVFRKAQNKISSVKSASSAVKSHA